MPFPDRIRIERDAASGVEAVHARFHAHAYDLHRHDEWLVGVTDSGLQDFFCRGARRRSTPGKVILIEPGEMHDGRAGDVDGFSYSMLYLPMLWFRAAVGTERSFSSTLEDDPALATAIRQACDAFGRPSERLARDAAVDAAIGCLRPHLRHGPPRTTAVADPTVASRARDAILAHLTENFGADDLARRAGATDRFQLARAFRVAYGTSPHAFLIQARLVKARESLRDGASPAVVATDCGFADQSHLGRWFRRAYGLTPAVYRSAGRTSVPDSTARFRDHPVLR